MRVNNPDDTPFEALNYFGVAIRLFPSGQRHTGMLYKFNDYEVRLCHLAFHYELRDEIPSRGYRWMEAGVDEVNRKYIAAYCANLRHNRDNIPYGFEVSGRCFDPETGEYIQQPPGNGLTCATFIIAVLNTLGYDVIKPDDWPSRPDDEEWQREMIGQMQRGGASAEHIEGLRKSVGAARYRPEETAGAVACDAWPVSFETAESLAREIMATIHGRA